jgi:hypothetical protein
MSCLECDRKTLGLFREVFIFVPHGYLQLKYTPLLKISEAKVTGRTPHSSPLLINLYPKSKAPDRFHLPVIRAVEIPFCGANVGMAHQSLDGSKVISIVQKGSGEGMPDHIGR